MAINKITAPLSTGPSVFAAPVINQLAALLTDCNHTKRASGGYILKGALFNIGGSMFLADSDTAISGTSSNYVKIIASGNTATAAYTTSVANVSWNGAYQGCFDNDGALYIAENQYGIRPIYTKLTDSGTYIVPPNCFEIHVILQGPGNDGGGGNYTSVGKGGDAGAVTETVIATTPLSTFAYTVTTTSTTFGSYTAAKGGGYRGENGYASGSGMGYGGAGGGYGGGAYKSGQGNGNSAIANTGGGGGGAGPSSSYSTTTTGGSGAAGYIIIL